MASFPGLRPSDLSRFLLITVRDVKYSVSELVLHEVFHSYGATTVQLCTSTTAVISFPSMSQATRAGLDMLGRYIYINCCWMQIQYAPAEWVAPATGAVARASSPSASTPAATPRSASISAARTGATPVPVCLQGAALASPAPSPSALTTADEEKTVVERLAELQPALDRMLASFAPTDDRDAVATSPPPSTTTAAVPIHVHGSGATSSPSTTTPPPTTPVQASPSLSEAPPTPIPTSVKAAVTEQAAANLTGANDIHLRATSPPSRAVIPAEQTTFEVSSAIQPKLCSFSKSPMLTPTRCSPLGLPRHTNDIQGQELPRSPRVMASSMSRSPRPPDWSGTTKHQAARPPPNHHWRRFMHWVATKTLVASTTLASNHLCCGMSFSQAQCSWPYQHGSEAILVPGRPQCTYHTLWWINYHHGVAVDSVQGRPREVNSYCWMYM